MGNDCQVAVGNSCDDASMFFNGETCISCGDGCSACNVLGRCINCEMNYVLDKYGVCNPCPQNCLTCSSSNSQICTQCASGYGLDYSSTNCIKCTNHCQSCGIKQNSKEYTE